MTNSTFVRLTGRHHVASAPPEGDPATEEARGAVSHRLGQVKVVAAGHAVKDFGDDDQFGELAGGRVEDVAELAALRLNAEQSVLLSLFA